MLLIVFMISCHVSEKWNNGPLTSHTTTKLPAIANAQGRPLRVAVSEATLENQCFFRRFGAALSLLTLAVCVMGTSPGTRPTADPGRRCPVRQTINPVVFRRTSR